MRINRRRIGIHAIVVPANGPRTLNHQLNGLFSGAGALTNPLRDLTLFQRDAVIHLSHLVFLAQVALLKNCVHFILSYFCKELLPFSSHFLFLFDFFDEIFAPCHFVNIIDAHFIYGERDGLDRSFNPDPIQRAILLRFTTQFLLHHRKQVHIGLLPAPLLFQRAEQSRGPGTLGQVHRFHPGRSAFSCLTADDSELKRILDTSPFYYETLLSASLALRFKLRPAVPYLALALYSCVLTRMAISSCWASSSALTFFFFFVGRTFTK